MAGGCTYFEFKSVRKVPPTNFNEQFVKDLLNDDVERLSQIKWIFDGEKIKKADLEALKDRIDALDIPEPAWKKFEMSSAEELKEKLKTDVIFNDIFKVE